MAVCGVHAVSVAYDINARSVSLSAAAPRGRALGLHAVSPAHEPVLCVLIKLHNKSFSTIIGWIRSLAGRTPVYSTLSRQVASVGREATTEHALETRNVVLGRSGHRILGH